ncbi:MAG: hypothetical protein SGILL_003147 [Bacillariaceae sp.]
MGKKHQHHDKSKVHGKSKSASSESHPRKKRKGHSDEHHQSRDRSDADPNPLYTQQAAFLNTFSQKERDHFFSTSHVDPDRRAQLWMQQADVGEEMVNRYAWATPSPACIKIFQEFSPIIELGCGRNAYWANVMKRMGTVDVVSYDSNVESGGVIGHSKKKKKKRKKGKDKSDELSNNAVIPKPGGPEVLELPENQNRTLFLCYPDEEDGEAPEDDYDNDGRPPLSFGWQCLESYQGQYVIHVGELAFLDTTLSMDQAPWGRSSSLEFQQRLASEYHCLLKIQLPNWLNVRDSISVWKRSEVCPIVFAGDEDDSDDEEEVIEYRHIPPEELLPRNIAAPCLAHLLPPETTAASDTTTREKRKRTENHDGSAPSDNGNHKKQKKKKKKQS